MKGASQPFGARTRHAAVLLAVLSTLASGCGLQPRPELEAYKRDFYKVRFDSAMSIVGTPRALYDTVPTVLADVVEIVGRAVGGHADTVLIAPSYVLIADNEHPGEGRTIRRGGRGVLPDVLLVPLHPGLRVEPLPTGASPLRMMGPIIAGLLTTFLLYQYGRH